MITAVQLQTIPLDHSEQNLNALNRANHFRRMCEFDKALEIYDKILNQGTEDSKIYWLSVLSRYGIEYVDDPKSGQKIPTCHRVHYRSILEDPDYLQALEKADPTQKRIYEQEAERIYNIQKEILEISNKEEPFDVFICYKESDENDQRTIDSVLAQDLYYGLVNEGFKVFFSRITLENKLGSAYEPYIFATLNSARVMVVLGTKAEYFNATWVKNEWSRYLAMKKNDKSKLIIPAYRDMSPYELPDELAYFQAQDMSKIGFLQDLTRGIKKVINSDVAPKEVTVADNTVVHSSANIENLIKRGNLALEYGEWEEATSFFESVLAENVEDVRGHIGKLMAELNLHTEADFDKSNYGLIEKLDNYKKAYRFASDDVKKKLEYWNKIIYYNFLYYYIDYRVDYVKNITEKIEVAKELKKMRLLT